jgi:3',5'-nucleoside bisphosphate phosphatase
VSEASQRTKQAGSIDLHTHTNESDGSLNPEELVQAATQAGLAALAITDHDTFAGYEKALHFARRINFDLVRGIELSSRLDLNGNPTRWAHILAFFPFGEPSKDFEAWLETQREDRRDRNKRLIASLARQGVDITLEEVEAAGRSLTSRPHFAKVLVEKGYASSHDDAFERYIGEDAPAFVERQNPATETVIQLIRSGGGIPVVAHPVRLMLPHDAVERDVLLRLKQAGLLGLEVYHSEHSPELQRYYVDLAAELGLLPSGGSDFHGAAKPDTKLGSGRNGNIRVPFEFLENMRALRQEFFPTVH